MRLGQRSTVAWLLIVALISLQLGLPPEGRAYVIDNFWPDANNIVMDDVFLPAATWSSPAQFQLSEWNEVDTTDNSHPFRINLNPQFSFGADDGDNTMGFLGEAGLNSEYGLSYAAALAWAVCWSGSSGRLDECDMMLNSALPWSLTPDSNNFFQSTVLHEAGHIRGLDHFNTYLSMQNSGTDKILRDEILYMDDKEGVRQNASHVSEWDMVIYRKFHTGTVPQWMSASPTTQRVGQVINFNNITVENRGTNVFNGNLRFGAYMSTNTIISTADTLLNTGSWSSFGRFTFSTFNWSVVVPFVNDCGTYYFGGIIDDNNAWAERFEGNNSVAFSNNAPDPQPFTILLARDALEPNDTFATARPIALPFSNSNLSIDADLEQDFYRFTLASPSQVSIALSFTHANGDVDLDLRNSSNVILQSSTSVSNSESISSSLAPGTYYIRAYGFGTGSCNRYSMTVSATPTVPSVSITALDPTAAEAGLLSGTFKVTRTGSTSGPLAVGYTLAGTAGNGADYQSLSGTVTIASGLASATFKVKPINDTLIEGTETVVATLAANPATYVIGSPSSATVTIADNDQVVVSITVPDATATEASATVGTFKVTRTGSLAAPLIVNYTLGGSAGNGADYLSLPGNVTIPAGAASALIKVKPVNDTLVEGNETVVATLAGGAYVIGTPRTGTVTIVDNDD